MHCINWETTIRRGKAGSGHVLGLQGCVHLSAGILTPPTETRTKPRGLIFFGFPGSSSSVDTFEGRHSSARFPHSQSNLLQYTQTTQQSFHQWGIFFEVKGWMERRFLFVCISYSRLTLPLALAAGVIVSDFRFPREFSKPSSASLVRAGNPLSPASA